MQKKNTPKNRKGSRQTKPDQLQALRERIGVQVTSTDRKTARTLDALYKNEQTPPLIRHTIFQLFWDSCQHHGLKLPKNFNTKWLPFWETICACNRKQGYVSTSIRYSWQAIAEDSTQLDAEERETSDARAIFDLIHNKQLAGSDVERIREGVTAILDKAHPFHCLESFLTCWPLALERLEQEKASEQ